jgi:hypothetical protein
MRAPFLFLLFGVACVRAQALLVDAPPLGALYARTSTFGAVVSDSDAARYANLTLVAAAANASACTLEARAPAGDAVLLVDDTQPAVFSRSCTEVQMCARAFSLGYRAVLVGDASGTRGPPLLNSSAPLHAMRGVAPELAASGFVALYVSRATAAALRALAANATRISLLASRDDRAQHRAWLAAYEGWVAAACVSNGVLFLGALAVLVYVCTRGARPTTSLAALACAGASALVLVIFAGAAYERARPFLSTPGYAVLADLNEALQVVALVLYVHAWAAAAAAAVRVPALGGARAQRAVVAAALCYAALFVALTIARGYAEALWNVPVLLNLAVLVVVVAAFVVLGTLIAVRARASKSARVAAIVRRALAFMCVSAACVVGKLAVVVAALAQQEFVQETYAALLLAFDTLIVASIIAIVASVVPALRASTESASSTPRAERLARRAAPSASASASIGASMESYALPT